MFDWPNRMKTWAFGVAPPLLEEVELELVEDEVWELRLELMLALDALTETCPELEELERGELWDVWLELVLPELLDWANVDTELAVEELVEWPPLPVEPPPVPGLPPSPQATIAIAAIISALQDLVFIGTASFV